MLLAAEANRALTLSSQRPASGKDTLIARLVTFTRSQMGCGFSSSPNAPSRRVHVKSASNISKLQRLCTALDHSDDVVAVKKILGENSPSIIEAPLFPLRDGSGHTNMLMYAARSGRIEVVRYLLAEGYKCSVTDVVDAEASNSLHPQIAGLLRGSGAPFLPWGASGTAGKSTITGTGQLSVDLFARVDD
eukprot:SAG31_NODE_2174_length_6257_cov_1.750244_8_plen_189_part_01